MEKIQTSEGKDKKNLKYFSSAEAQETTVKIHIITFSLTKQFKIFANLCCYRNQTFQIEKNIKMETSKYHMPKKATESDSSIKKKRKRRVKPNFERNRPRYPKKLGNN